jgi:hypothetical protein
MLNLIVRRGAFVMVNGRWEYTARPDLYGAYQMARPLPPHIAAEPERKAPLAWQSVNV